MAAGSSTMSTWLRDVALAAVDAPPIADALVDDSPTPTEIRQQERADAWAAQVENIRVLLRELDRQGYDGKYITAGQVAHYFDIDPAVELAD